MSSFIHAADLHLSKSWHRRFGLSGDAEHSFSQIVDIAIARRVDALILAGDIFDSPFPSCSSVTAFVTHTQRLTAAGIKLYFITGNHDPVTWPLASRTPNVVCLDGQGLISMGAMKLYGINYAPPAQLLEKLLKVPAEANVVVLHAMVEEFTGGLLASDCSIGDLPISARGDRYYALGDLHEAKTHHEAASRITAVYPGSSFCTKIDEAVEKSVVHVCVSVPRGDITWERIPLITRRIYRLTAMDEDGIRKLLTPRGWLSRIQQTLESWPAEHEVVKTPVIEIKYLPTGTAASELMDAYLKLGVVSLQPRAMQEVTANMEVATPTSVNQLNLRDVVREVMADTFDVETAELTEELIASQDPASVLTDWFTKKQIV